MPQRTPTLTEEIQATIAVAEGAVAKISDTSLKPIAFQVVLNHLLGDGDEPKRGIGKRGAMDSFEDEETKKEEKPSKGKTPKGVKARLETLIEDNYFNQKRTLGEVRTELSNHGWNHRREDVNSGLARMLDEKQLRRIKEQHEGGGRLVWKYSIW